MPVLIAETDAAGGSVLLPGLTGQARRPDPDDIALVLHTSGSTGRPKRVPLRHRNLAASAQNIARTYALAPEDVSLCLMPLFHVHGLMASTMATFFHRRNAWWCPPSSTPLAFWRTVREHGATWYSAVPTIHQLLLAAPRERRTAPSAALHPLVQRLALAGSDAADGRDHFGVPVLEAYGMTEASHQMASNPLPPARASRARSAGHGRRISIMRRDRQRSCRPAARARSASRART